MFQPGFLIQQGRVDSQVTATTILSSQRLAFRPAFTREHNNEEYEGDISNHTLQVKKNYEWQHMAAIRNSTAPD